MSPWSGSVMALFVRPHSGTQAVEAMPARPRGSTAPRGAAAAPREHPADFLPVPLAWSARQGHSVEGMPVSLGSRRCPERLPNFYTGSRLNTK